MDFDSKLIVKYLLEELTPEEFQALLEWQKQSDENASLFSSLTHFRIHQQYVKYSDPEKVVEALLKANQRITRKRPSARLSRAGKCAAIFLLVCAMSYAGWQYFTKTDDYISIVVGEKESMKKLSLADGTVLWLNSGSALRVPESFTAHKRKAFLDGEAYFDVKKDSLHPFLLQTEMLDIKVLGTSFNVKTDREKGELSTVLVSGKVLLQDKGGLDVFQMSPGEKVVYNASARQYAIETVNPATYTTWHLNQLIFENATLREIVNKLSLIYDVNINLQSKQLADRRYRCVINRDETLVEVLEILSYLAPIHYRIEEDEVFISK